MIKGDSYQGQQNKGTGNELSITTVLSYMNILCSLRGTQNLPYNVLKQDQNDIFPERIGQTEYNANAIF